MKRKHESLKELVHSHKMLNDTRKSNLTIQSPTVNRLTRRSCTLPKENIHKILTNYEKTHKASMLSPERAIKNEVMPPLIHKTERSVKLFPLKIKSRFKGPRISNNKIPQGDYLVYLLDKVPTFEIVREKNIEKNKRKILKLIRPIIEDQNEYNNE